ncbi:MAG: Maf family nucleotide pyrophosphatase [Proteobacteria bacterium]|nr:Maf family nucleotide pyrophosphatase [Pseudomonadota bacterium]
MDTDARLYLASTSPRRRRLLASLGIDFEIADVDVDETPLEDEPAADMVLRLAVAKAGAAAAGARDLVLAADTAVVVDDETLGKPCAKADALQMLERLSGRAHRVLTGVALRGPHGMHTALSDTDVYFREIGRDEALAYWQSGEPRDKAGSYAVQGLGGALVRRMEGSYSGVVGLPVFETVALLRDAGLDVMATMRSND